MTSIQMPPMVRILSVLEGKALARPSRCAAPVLIDDLILSAQPCVLLSNSCTLFRKSHLGCMSLWATAVAWPGKNEWRVRLASNLRIPCQMGRVVYIACPCWLLFHWSHAALTESLYSYLHMEVITPDSSIYRKTDGCGVCGHLLHYPLSIELVSLVMILILRE